MYRNRLVRTFLGVSRPRSRSAAERIHGIRRDRRRAVRIACRTSGRPLHVVNTTLNLVAENRLAVAERKAASFTMSALHAGSRHLGYRPAATYAGGITLGEALTTSGAAVSSNMGAYASRAMTFLLTVFNARLGVWLGNPGAPGDAHVDARRAGVRRRAARQRAARQHDRHEPLRVPDRRRPFREPGPVRDGAPPLPLYRR